MALTPVLLPGKSHGPRSLEGCSPWGRWGSDVTEQLPFQFSLSCIGEGNGNPLQCSCLENPRDSGARWAAVYGVAQSRTRLKRLSSSSSSSSKNNNSQKNTDMCHSFQMGRLEILFETLKFLLLGLNLIHDGGLIEFYWIYSTLLVEIHVYMYSQFR